MILNQLIVILFLKVMSAQAPIKKQNDGQLNLYRLMRLQNRENNFIYRDSALKYHSFEWNGPSLRGKRPFQLLLFPPPSFSTQFRVSYQHFPLETVNHNELLKTFWKFITTHHFKKIDQEENYKINYLHRKFNHSPARPNLHNVTAIPQKYFHQFSNDLHLLISNSYLQDLAARDTPSLQDTLWMKRMVVAWAEGLPLQPRKTKKIAKLPALPRKGRPPKKGGLVKMKQEEAELNQIIDMIDFQQADKIKPEEEGNIDQQILQLELQLQRNEEENRARVSSLEGMLREEQEWMTELEERQASGEDASCIEWLLHILEEKQIAESITKVVSCERSGGQSKFLIHFETAMNIVPQLVSEVEMRRINLLREVSLFKFYKTGVKSIYSYACHNYAGLADMYNNRTGLSKLKEKDYMQMMKKGAHLSAEVKRELDEFDVCHHCKYIYPSYLLTTCKFVSDRQAMPKTSQFQPDLHLDTNLQRGRISQRFVAKHRNCYNGYARINEEYVCGRKFCKSCIKDCYGSEWMKNNNGLCPFCLGVCSCTRCLRHEKMNKLKAFFLGLGGDLMKLQEQSQIQKLPIKKDEIIYKPKQKAKRSIKNKGFPSEKEIAKSKLISKSKLYLYQSNYASEKKMPRLKYSELQRSDLIIEEQTERWSSTAEKQLNSGRRISKRKILTRLY